MRRPDQPDRGWVDDCPHRQLSEISGPANADTWVSSDDAANATATRLGRGVIIVVPVTSNTARIYPFQVLLPASQTGLRQDSKAQAEQVRSIAAGRVGERIGQLTAALINELDQALRLHLSL